MRRFFKRRITLIGSMGFVMLGIGGAQAADEQNVRVAARSDIGLVQPASKVSGPFVRSEFAGEGVLRFGMLNFPESTKSAVQAAVNGVGGDLLDVGLGAKPIVDRVPSGAGDSEVFSVPLPAAVWSFLFGLMGVLGIQKRKRVSGEIH